MTCIVGYVDKKQHTVFLGGDSAATDAHHQQILLLTPKVFRVGEALFGCMGNFRMMQLLHYCLPLPHYPKNGDVEQYMTKNFVNAVRACFQKGGYAQKEDGREQGGTFLVGMRGRLFCVDEDYAVWETHHDYTVIGNGDNLALGALYALQQIEMSPQQRVTLALEAAAFHNSTVRPPFLIECIEMHE